jgi:hypothetical protein
MILKLPFLNPVRFHDATSGQFAIDIRPSFEVRRGYAQKFNISDFLYLQFHFQTAPATFTVYLMQFNGLTATDSIADTISTSQILDINFSNLYSYELNYTFSTAGTYYLKAEITIGVQSYTLYSEPILVKTSHANTIAIFYDNLVNDYDFLFTTANCFGMMLRIEGGMKSDGLQPGGKFEMYHDLDYVSEQLNASVFNVEKWTFGPSAGMPNYMFDKLNRIFALSTSRIDGVEYVRNDGAKWERKGSDDYPLCGVTIDLVKKENNYSDEVIITGDPVIPLTCDNDSVTVDSDIITSDQTQY